MKLDNDIRHQTREFEKEFGGITNSQVEVVNVPDEFPPEIPRLKLKSANKQITLSKQNIQMSLTFERDDSKDIKSQFQIISKNVNKFWGAVCKFRGQENRKEVGVVLTLNCPSDKSPSEIAALNFDRFSKIEKLGEVAHFNVSAGFKSNGFYKIFNSSSYEVRTGQIKYQGGLLNSIDVNDLKLEEVGFEYKFDVNNKLKVQEIGFSNDASGTEIIDELNRFLFIDSTNLIG